MGRVKESIKLRLEVLGKEWETLKFIGVQHMQVEI